MSETTPRTFTGGCHCGNVKYEVELELPEQPEATRCNCTICLKSGFTGLTVKPEKFHLKSPAFLENIPSYQARTPTITRRFCNRCATSIVTHGFYEINGKRVDFFSLNANSLDQPQEGLDLSTFKIMYASGRDDNWMAGAKDVPYPGGLI